MANTLSFSPAAEGWPSFYSFDPDFMLGMNNYFYTWNEGKLYRHNTNPGRGTFYGDQYPSEVTTVFNDAPLSNLLWKTIHLESTSAWETTMSTDIQSGYIEQSWYERKEAAWFGFVRNNTVVDPSAFALRSSVGVGTITAINPITLGYEITFPFNLGTMMHQGDALFAFDGQSSVGLLGYVTEVTYNQETGETVVAYTISGIDPPPPPPSVGYFVVYRKNVVAESTGVLGHYNVITLSIQTSLPTELFAVEAEVMASFPYP